MTRACNDSDRLSRREALGQLAAGVVVMSVLRIENVRLDAAFATGQRDAGVAPRARVQTVTGPIERPSWGSRSPTSTSA